MKKDAWKNNLGLKVVALLFSVILWWTVVNIDDPLDKAYYETEVELLNTDIITNQGQSFDLVNSQKVIVTVKARRKVLEKIKTSNIKATADFTEHNEETDLVPIRVKIEGFASSVEEYSCNPINLQIKREMIESNTFPISTEKVGSVRDGYILANATPKPKSIEISGPGSILNRISKVVAKVDVSGVSDNCTLQAEMIYYDSANNELPKATLTSKYDKIGVFVDLEIWRTKDLEMHFDTSAIQTAPGYVFDSIIVEPKTVKVAGTDEVIIPMSSIDIPKEALQTEPLKENGEIVVNMAEYLPEGIVLAEEEANVVVKIIIEKAGTKSLRIPARSIKVENVSEDFEISYDGEQEVEIMFEGPNEELQLLTNSVISATIDLKELKEEGTYDVPVSVADLPNQCRYLGGATVQITLVKK